MHTKKSIKTMLVLALATALVPIAAYAADDVSDTAYVIIEENSTDHGNGTLSESPDNNFKFETGNVTVNAAGQSYAPEYIQKNGLYAASYVGVETDKTLNVEAGNVTVTNNDQSQEDKAGVRIDAYGNVSHKVNVKNITSDAIGLDIYKGGENQKPISVKAGDITSKKDGVNVLVADGVSKIDVGNVLLTNSELPYLGATAGVKGIFISSGNTLTAKDITSSDVGAALTATQSGGVDFKSGNIKAKADGLVAIVSVAEEQETDTPGSITATVDGSVDAGFKGVVSEVYGVERGSVDITVNGDVKASDNGVELSTGKFNEKKPLKNKVTINGNINTSGDVLPTGILAEYTCDGSTIEANVNGDVNVSGSNSLGVYFRSLSSPSNHLVNVQGNVNSDSVGIYCYEGQEEQGPYFDVLVSDTISADNVGVLLEEELDSGRMYNNLDLTVWKIKRNENGNVAELGRVSDYGTGSIEFFGADERTRKFEESIKYIIKVEKPTGGHKLIALCDDGSSLDVSHNYQIAYEGDTVILKALPKKGYRVVSAYNGLDGEKVALRKDANGNFYIKVPKGGGVYLSALFEKIKYTISYDLQGGLFEGQTGVIKFQSAYGDKITLLPAPVRSGYRFVCWQGSNYMPGDTYKVVGDHLFTAVWEKIEDEKCDCKTKKCCCKCDKCNCTSKIKTGDERNKTAWLYAVFAAISGFVMSIFPKKSRKSEK